MIGIAGTYNELVWWIVKIQNAHTYLEIGVMYGDTFNEIRKIVPRAIGVDVNKRDTVIPKCEFYEMTSDNFFGQFKEKADVIFIDADHRFEQLVKDFENSLNILNQGGTIIMHDTDPCEKKRLVPTSCADSYKIIEHIHVNHPELDIVTFPVSVMGISVVRRKNDRRVLGLLCKDLCHEISGKLPEVIAEAESFAPLMKGDDFIKIDHVDPNSKNTRFVHRKTKAEQNN